MAKKTEEVQTVERVEFNDTVVKLREDIDATDSSITALIETIGNCEENLQKIIQSGKGPIAVSEIDGNLTFQQCLGGALNAVCTGQNIHMMLKTKEHRAILATQIVDFAEEIHAVVCERFTIQN